VKRQKRYAALMGFCSFEVRCRQQKEGKKGIRFHFPDKNKNADAALSAAGRPRFFAMPYPNARKDGGAEEEACAAPGGGSPVFH
jgi:hypothetical protein